jgi:hypothetical protein
MPEKVPGLATIGTNFHDKEGNAYYKKKVKLEVKKVNGMTAEDELGLE